MYSGARSFRKPSLEAAAVRSGLVRPRLCTRLALTVQAMKVRAPHIAHSGPTACGGKVAGRAIERHVGPPPSAPVGICCPVAAALDSPTGRTCAWVSVCLSLLHLARCSPVAKLSRLNYGPRIRSGRGGT